MSDKNKKQIFDEQEDLQICKELIDRELSKDEHEIDTDAINRWVDEMLQLQGLEYQADEQSDQEEIKQVFARFASSEQKNVSKEKPRHRIKKTIISVLAAAILLAALSLTAYGFWGPSETFMQNIRQILSLERGEMLTISEEEFYSDNYAKQYDTLEEFTKIENISILSPENIPLIKKAGITFYYYGASDTDIVQCVFSNHVEMQVYLTNAPYPKDVMEDLEDIEKLQIGEYKCYIIDNYLSGTLSFVLYDRDYVYVVTSADRDALIDTVNQLK